MFNRELTGAEITNLYTGYSSVPVFTPYCTNLTVTLSAGSNSCVVVTNDITITNGLVAWYKADGNANDSYGTNNGTLEGGAGFAASQSGQAFSIQPPPAVQDVNLGLLKGLDQATGITVSAYVKATPTTNNAFVVFCQGELPGTNPPTSTAQYFGLAVGTNYFSMALPFANSSNTFSDFFKVSYNVSTQWQHLAVTWRNTDGLIVLYANGVMVGSTNFHAGAVIPPATNNLTAYPTQTVRLGNAFIGAASFGVSGYYDAVKVNNDGGTLDNLRLYTRALSASEIQQIMQADSGAAVTNCTTMGATTTNLDFCTAPPGKLQILSAPSGNVQLFWPSQTNAWYLLQGSDDLLPLDWINVGDAQLGNGSNVIVPDATTSRPRRFYRLLSTEP